MIDEPFIVNDMDMYSFDTIDEHIMAIFADMPDLGMAGEPIVDKTHEITTTNASATVVATTLVTSITSPPSTINPGHSVHPADPLLLRHEAASLTNITNINDHAAVLPHTGTPRHQRTHLSIHNDDSLSPLQPAFLSGATDQSAGPFSSPTKVMPCLRPQDTLIRTLEEKLALEEAAAAEMAATVAASPYHNLLPVMSQPSRPLYLRALAERAAAEAAAAASTPTPPTPVLAAPAPAPPPSQRAPKHNENTTSVMEAPVEETGRRIRRLTVFGVQREKAVEEQKAKAAKAADRKADREKAVNEERVKSIGAGSKKIAVRGKKGKKMM
jgi:hypothetical protein